MVIALSQAIFDRDPSSLDKTCAIETLVERGHDEDQVFPRETTKEPDHGYRRLLPPSCKRPRRQRATKKQYLAPSHVPPKSDSVSYRFKIAVGTSDLCLLWVKSGHDRANLRCLLYPRKRTFANAIGMSAKCQKRTSRLLFDHFVGAG
jgi:hypothetical protein